MGSPWKVVVENTMSHIYLFSLCCCNEAYHSFWDKDKWLAYSAIHLASIFLGLAHIPGVERDLSTQNPTLHHPCYEVIHPFISSLGPLISFWIALITLAGLLQDVGALQRSNTAALWWNFCLQLSGGWKESKGEEMKKMKLQVPEAIKPKSQNQKSPPPREILYQNVGTGHSSLFTYNKK